MPTLPLPARLYLWLVIAAGISLPVLAQPNLDLFVQNWFPAICILIGLVLAHQAEVVFEPRPGQRATFAVDDALIIFSLITFGSSGVALVASSLLIAQISRRKPWERVLFNTAMLSITYSVVVWLLAFIPQTNNIPFAGIWGMLEFVVMAVAYYTTNTLLVSVMIGLVGNQSILRVYRNTIAEASWVHGLIYVIGASMAALYAVDPWLLIYGVITLILARSSFATVVALQVESQQRRQLAEERIELYEEQTRLNAELMRNARLVELGTLSAGIAHEFNNMVTAIIGNAQLGRMSDDLADKEYSLEMIERACQRATGITSSLLTFARQREPDLEPGRLQTAIEETMALMRLDLERDAVQVQMTIDDVPELLLDLGQINQVLLNLLKNALDAVRGRSNPTISVLLSQQDSLAVLQVRDNGSGIPPEILERMFQPFVTTKKRGNGLGMAICYGIVTAHQGNISISSEQDRGTTVTLCFPLSAETITAYSPHSDSMMLA